jgi:hypothetical protein
MSKKVKKYPVSKRVNWALTCKDKISIPYNTFKKEDGIYISDKTFSFTYPVSGVISFNNHIQHSVNLTPVATHLLTYLSQVMNSITNEFHNDASTRQHFLDSLNINCEIIYEDGTVCSAIKLLKKEGYIIKRNTANRHIINPLYYYRGDIQDRNALIKELVNEGCDPRKGNKNIKKHILGFNI